MENSVNCCQNTMWTEYENVLENNNQIGFIQKMSILKTKTPVIKS